MVIGVLFAYFSKEPIQYGKLKIGGSGKEESELIRHKRIMKDLISHYKDFKKEVKEDLEPFLKGLFTLFLSTFNKALLDYGESPIGIEHSDEVVAYEISLEKALDTIVLNNIKKTIYKNHFPVRLTDKDGNFTESEKEFSIRLKAELTEPVFSLVCALSVTSITRSWLSKKVSRKDYCERYLEEANAQALEYLNELFIVVQKRRNLLKAELIRNFPELTDKRIEAEWRAMYE